MLAGQLVPIYRDVAIGSKSLINSVRRATVINVVQNNFQAQFSKPGSVTGRDVFQMPAKQQAVEVGCYFARV